MKKNINYKNSKTIKIDDDYGEKMNICNADELKKNNANECSTENNYGDNYSTASSDIQINKENISLEELKSNVKNAKVYMDDIFQNLIEEEKIQMNNINSNYFNCQPEITPYMRSILIDWIIDINRQFKFKEETLYLTIYFIDAYLSKKYIEKRNFQLLGISSLLISSKLNEVFLRKISDYSDITYNTYKIKDILNMEKDILKTLNFDLLIPTPLSFYEIISQKLGISDDINKFQFGEFLMQSFLINNISINYSSSTIAYAVCYILAKFCKMENYRMIFDNNNLCNVKENICNNNNNYSNEYVIKDCAKKICETIAEIINSNINSTVNKYSDNIFFNNIKNNFRSNNTN